ncbi:unnamed protein product (macronuclear) [Paramecium tetraurelia]|uniref:DNA polymerase delta small subunit n=1 Tax=Paramecium tetraurelia TaxID=5888 RepID=A0E2K0_PARTE|nr:uncharacterized protein GSPATT00022689001 [Paramecium tetraurelia]CAK89517.1 unnamed protein product [Paramecium tetraurelia]|eukprot:XP_001456914.1 hypothetical protein (macronuclear) [Paramecium tetraurelia strain d4-2]
MEVEKNIDTSFIFEKLKSHSEKKSQHQRIGLEIKQSTKFYLVPRDKCIKTQYCNIYSARYLNLVKRFQIDSEDPQFIELIQKIQDQKGTIKAIGTLFKEMKLKPYYFSQNQNKALQGRSYIHIQDYVSNEDVCYLEDGSGRIKLQISNAILCLPNKKEKIVNVSDLVTGITLMIEGQIVANNIIKVEKFYLPSLPETPMLKQLNSNSYLCLISGLNYNALESTTKYRHMIDYLQGNLYSGEGGDIPYNISQVIFTGNLYCKLEETLDQQSLQQDFKGVFSKIQLNIKGVDELISQLASVTPVAVMPGENEPVSQMLPQTPLHRSHFPETFEKEHQLILLSNPTEFTLGDLKILGTSGQNISDIKKCSQVKNQEDVDLLEMTMFYGNIAPTAPDTLISFPQKDQDPFVLQELPNIYFVGNMQKFGTKMVADNVRIVSVPAFSETGTICLINLSTLECFPVIIQ